MVNPTRGYSVLVVEDDADTALLISRYLTAQGVTVRRASDGRQAWEMFQQDVPDLVLSDLMLPWMTGGELVRLIRSHPRGAAVPVVVASASVSPGRADEIRDRLGVQAALGKPLALREMMGVLDRCMEEAASGPPAGGAAHEPNHDERHTEPGDLADALAAEGPGAAHANAEGALAALLLAARARRADCQVDVRDAAGVRRLVVRDGLLVAAESSVPDESLAAALRTACMLAPAQVAAAARLAREQDQPFPLAVAHLAGVEPWVVAVAVQRHARRIILEALCAWDGVHDMTAYDALADLHATLRLDPVMAIQQAVLHVLPEDQVEAELARRCAAPPRATSIPAVVPTLLRAVAAEGGAACQLPPTLFPAANVGAMLSAALGAERRQWVALLCSAGGGLEERPVVGTPEDGRDWVGESTAAEERAVRNRVAEEFLRTHRAPAWAVLGVGEQAGPEEVDAAAEAHRGQFGPPALDAGLRTGPARVALEVIRTRRDAAARTLLDGEVHARHLQAWEDARAAVAARVRRPPPLPAPLTPPPLTPPPVPAPAGAPRGPVVGGCELLDRLAVGGAAEVYRARALTTGELVVVKRLRPEVQMDIPAVTGFMRESDVMQRLNHPNVVRALARGEAAGEPFLVMELVDGLDLERAWQAARRRGVTVAPGVWTHVVMEALLGLEHAHRARGAAGALGLVHRDLAPRNVLLGLDGTVRITDFGACVFTHVDAPPLDVVGSAGYLSPEQARLDVLDARSDVFAVGCVLQLLLTGEPAFPVEGRDDGEVLAAHQQCRAAPLPRGLHAALRQVLERALAPHPEDRFISAREMAESLDNARRAAGHVEGGPELGALVSALRRADPRRAAGVG
ncbi:MAG: protein kinase [Deltaproteobacteria bacterium]|nr:protein kinase [Deltaproteobacteria bacterium]